MSASPLAFLFIAFGLMFLVPGYPVLCSVFFVTLGLFHSFQAAREANDIVFSSLLPVGRHDLVLGKFLFVCLIEGCSFALMTLSTLLRMFLLAGAPVYRDNPLMTANPFALGAALLIFALFNRIFVGGFFKTAWKQGRPFVVYCIVCFLTITAAETLHHIPGLGMLNAQALEHTGLQLVLLAAGAAAYALITLRAFHKACCDFDRIDL